MSPAEKIKLKALIMRLRRIVRNTDAGLELVKQLEELIGKVRK